MASGFMAFRDSSRVMIQTGSVRERDAFITFSSSCQAECASRAFASLRSPGENERHAGAFANLALDCRLSAMERGDPFDDRQPKADASEPRGTNLGHAIEAIEDARQ